MIWASSSLFARHGFTLWRPLSRSVVGKRLIGSALASKIHSFCIAGVQGTWSTLQTNPCRNERERPTGSFLHHEGRLSSTAVRFKIHVWLSSPDDAFTTTREVFGEERPDPSPAVVLSFATGIGDIEGDLNFEDMPPGSYSGCELCRAIHFQEPRLGQPRGAACLRNWLGGLASLKFELM